MTKNRLIWLISGSVVFSVGLMATIITIWQPGYAGNDDALLASIPSGSFTGEPDGRMVFTGPLIGFPLAGLYSLWSEIPFYMYMEYLAMALSLAAAIVVSVILGRRALVPVWLGVTFLWFAVFARWLLDFTFTPVAFLVSSAGFLFLLLAIQKTKGSIWFALTAGVLVALGGVLRPEPLIGVLGVFAPFLLVALWRTRFRASALFVGGLGIVFGLNWLTRKIVYPGEVWAAYLWSDPNRSEILDTPAMGASFLFAEKAGLTQNDYSLFYQNGYLDRTVFSPETMQRLVDVTSGATGSGEGFIYAPSLMWSNFLNYSAPARSLLLIGIAFALISLINLANLRQRLIFLGVLLVNLVWFSAILYYLGESRKVAAHVQLPLTYIFLMLILLAPLAFLSESRVRPSRSWQATLSRTGLALVPALVVYFALGNPFANLGSQSEANIARQATTERFIAELVALDPQAAYISICCTVPWEGADPTKARPFDGWPVQIVGGWPPFTPMWDKRNEMLGISDGIPKDPYGTTDLVQALIKNPKVRLIATEQAAGALAGQMSQYRKWDGCFTPIARLSNNAMVYQASPKEEC